MPDKCKPKMQNLLAALRAVGFLHHTAHWQAKGPTFYGDHLLLERLYSGITDEVDGLGERMTAMFGGDAVDAEGAIDRMAAAVKKYAGTKDQLRNLLNMEKNLQALIASLLTDLESEGELDADLENYLQGLASAHKTAVYLLGQRLA